MGTGDQGAGSRLIALDALRGIAALLVVLHHAERSYGASHIFGRCYLAVDLFFLLSGFVIAYRYDERLGTTLSCRRFMRARLRKLWPMMAVGVVLGAALLGFKGADTRVLAWLTVTELLFVPSFTGRLGLFRLDGVQWSLLFELLANLGHAFCLHRIADRGLAWLVIGCGALLAIIAREHGSLAVGDCANNWALGVVRIAFPYLAGVLLCRRWRAGDGSRHGAALAPILATPAVLLAAGIRPFEGLWWLDPLLVLTVLPAILWSTATSRIDARLAGPAVAIGAISYPLYAVHLPLLDLGGCIAALFAGATGQAIRLVAILGVVLVAWLVARIGKRRAPPPPSVQAAAHC